MGEESKKNGAATLPLNGDRTKYISPKVLR